MKNNNSSKETATEVLNKVCSKWVQVSVYVIILPPFATYTTDNLY